MGCIEYWGHKDADGYGQIGVGAHKMRASRLAYSLYNGPLHKTHVVMHTCDNPACINPEHLVVGTQKQNQEDCRQKGRLGKRGRPSKAN